MTLCHKASIGVLKQAKVPRFNNLERSGTCCPMYLESGQPVKIVSALSARELLGFLLSEVCQNFVKLCLQASLIFLGIFLAVVDSSGSVLSRFLGFQWQHIRLPSACWQDANATKMALFRYLTTFRSDLNLDPHLQRYDWMFLTPFEKALGACIRRTPAFLRACTESFGFTVACRVAALDALFLEMVTTRRIEQVIILGAGYDSRAYRFVESRRQRPENRDPIIVRVLEVDRPGVQERKRRILRENLDAKTLQIIMEGVEYVPCDFCTPQALRHALEGSEFFDPSLPTLVICEGVFHYLDKNTIFQVLTTLTSLRAQVFWALAFDFLDQTTLTDVAPLRMRLILRIAQFLDEPLLTGFPSDREALNKLLKTFTMDVTHVMPCWEIVGKHFPRLQYGTNNYDLLIAQCEWL